MEKTIAQMTMEGIYQKAASTEEAWATIRKPYDAYWTRAQDSGLFETKEVRRALYTNRMGDSPLEKIREARAGMARILGRYERGLITDEELFIGMIDMKDKIKSLELNKGLTYRYAQFVPVAPPFLDNFENKVLEECEDYGLLVECIASN